MPVNTPQSTAQRRVAVLIPTPPSRHGGGAERVMMSIAAGLADRGVEVDFLVNRESEDCWGSLSPNVRLLSLDTWRYTCLPGLLKYIRRQRPHGLLSTMKSANLTALVAKKFFATELRLVIHQANSFSGELRTLSVKQRLALRAIRRLMPSADVIVTLNQAMATDIRDLAPGAAHKVRVIHDPFDIDEIIARSQAPGGASVAGLWPNGAGHRRCRTPASQERPENIDKGICARCRSGDLPA